MKVQETGFVEFVTDLISSTVDAVISSQMDQEKKQIELKQDLLLTKEQFIFKYDLLNNAKDILGDKVTKEEIDTYVDEYIESHKAILKQYFDKNALKVIVDRGKVSAKLIFSFFDDNSEDTKKKTTKTTLNKDIKKANVLRNLGRLTSPKERLLDAKMDKIIYANKNLSVRDNALTGRKMIVKTVDTSNKDMLDLKTDIISSVEFSFRTIVE
ncbi:hypothetical protein [Polaribacter butkevichii]|uniref:Uncharacterized protein n=1 Tax=Polaribacter butkevichii TaxID=218490 RepID=A0A2P6C861_9FLAO|nr:hypothetical protein [Polaribacter butkevichii]PQJ69117.1 hypothetical protein BTO14_13890 [Polaribacter butkevichii]